MRKQNRLFFLVLVDEDDRLFNVVGPMNDDSGWNTESWANKVNASCATDFLMEYSRLLSHAFASNSASPTDALSRRARWPHTPDSDFLFAMLPPFLLPPAGSKTAAAWKEIIHTSARFRGEGHGHAHCADEFLQHERLQSIYLRLTERRPSSGFAPRPLPQFEDRIAFG